MIFIRFPLAILMALFYQIAFNPYLQGVIFLIFGHWRIAAIEVAAWLLLCLAAVLTGVHRKSRLPGLETVDIFTARPSLYLLGDEEQGWTPAFLVAKWPKWVPLWVVAWSCCAWRNRLRNIAFWKPLAWLHRPSGKPLMVDTRSIGGVDFRLSRKGWMMELEWDVPSKSRFGKCGPRLEHPDAWGGVSWSFRPWAKYDN